MILVSRVVTFFFRKIDERRNARDARDDARRARREACISFPSNARARDDVVVVVVIIDARTHARTQPPNNQPIDRRRRPRAKTRAGSRAKISPSTIDQSRPGRTARARGSGSASHAVDRSIDRIDRSIGSIARARVPSIADVDRARPRALSNARSNDGPME